MSILRSFFLLFFVIELFFNVILRRGWFGLCLVGLLFDGGFGILMISWFFLVFLF